MEFLAAILAGCFDPIIFAGALLIGYLFSAEMPKLAWSLLLFVLPALPAGAATGHGLIFNSAAQFLAACLLTAIFYRLLDFWRSRRSHQSTP